MVRQELQISKKFNCSQRDNVAGEMERQDSTDVKEILAMTAKPMDTNRYSNDKKLTSLETLNYITMYLHMAKETNKFLMSNGKSRHY